MRALRFRTRQDELGSSLLELALTAPLLVLLLAGAVDFAGAWRAGSAVSAAAEAGALYGLRNPTDTAGMERAAALESSVSALQAHATRGCECSGGTSAVPNCTSAPTCSASVVDYVDVATTLTYTPSMPLPGLPADFTLQGHARLRAVHGSGQ